MIDLSKKYRTVVGLEVVLLSDNGPKINYPIVGYIKEQTEILCWSNAGISSNYGPPKDYLIECKEKIVVKAWINVIKYIDESPLLSIYYDEKCARHAAQTYRGDKDYKVLLEAEPYVREFDI